MIGEKGWLIFFGKFSQQKPVSDNLHIQLKNALNNKLKSPHRRAF
jgi:hypothetical protein